MSDRLPWAALTDRWSSDDIAEEFGDVVRAASPALQQYQVSGYGGDFWKEVVNLGWHAALLRDDFGGLGLDGRALAEIVGPLAVAGPSHAFLGTAVDAVHLLQSVPGKRCDQLLAEIGENGLRLQVALAETGEEPYGAEPATRVMRDAEGLVISGRKALVPYAAAADGFVVTAQDADTGSLVFVLVAADSPGVTVVPQDSLGLPLCDVVLDRVSIPESDLLASGIAVHSALEAWLDLTVALDAAALVAIGSEALVLTLTYTGERIAFDKPLAAFQAVQHHCANAFLRVEQTRVLARDALMPREDSVERAWASSLAKVKAAEGIIEVMRLAHRVHGGIGFYDDYPLADLTRRAVAIQGLHGSAAWHRQRLQRLVTNPANTLKRGVLSSPAALSAEQ